MATQMKGNVMARAVAVAMFMQEHANVTESVKNAVFASIEDRKIQDAAKKDKESAWGKWLGAGQVLADAGADVEMAQMVIDYVVGEDKISIDSVKTYRSRVSSLVPILALDDENYADLWKKADIRDSKGELEPTRVFNNQHAAKLLRAFRSEPLTEKEKLQAEVKRITRHFKDLLSPRFPDDATDEQKEATRAANIEQVTLQVAAVFDVLGLAATEWPEVPQAEEESDGSADNSSNATGTHG